MAKIEIVQKYFFRKNDEVECQGYDWIGGLRFGLYPVELNGKLGFANQDGIIVIPTIYDLETHKNGTVHVGNESYFDLQKNGMCGLLKHDGTVVIDFVWENMHFGKLRENLIPVSLNQKWGFVNVKTGELEIKVIYDEVEHFRNGFAPVRLGNNWAIIDKKGNLITPFKYLLDSYFEDDFAIVYEGGYYVNGRNRKDIYNSNTKLITKHGGEIIANYSWIERTGYNTFVLTQRTKDQVTKSVKQFIPLYDCIIVINDGEYIDGYLTSDGYYSKDFTSNAKHYKHAKYCGGGTWSAIDYNGKPIHISESRLQELMRNLLNN